MRAAPRKEEHLSSFKFRAYHCLHNNVVDSVFCPIIWTSNIVISSRCQRFLIHCATTNPKI